MNRRSLIRFSAALVLVMVAASSLAAPVDANRDAIFTKANSDYAAGHFRQAIDGYESLVRNRQWSASLFYDLGNAWFRAGEPGRAILNYERALALSPAQPETEANLRLVRDQARALELTRSWPAQHLAFLTVDHWTWVAAAAAWLAFFVACGLWFSSRRSALWIFVLSLAFAIGAGDTVPMTLLIVASFLTNALYAVLFGSSLQFIGLGDPNSDSWGTMLYWAENNEALQTGQYLWAIVPGACIAALGAAFALLNYAFDEIGNPALRPLRARRKRRTQRASKALAPGGIGVSGAR
jgi:tetratricopeptide (TPR) repeat protein